MTQQRPTTDVDDCTVNTRCHFAQHDVKFYLSQLVKSCLQL